MTGKGSARGAGTVVNAMATGFGAAFGLAFEASAVIEDAPSDEVRTGGRVLDAGQARLALEAVSLVAADRGAVLVDVTTDIPARKGLKSSSAVALAVLAAACEHFELAHTPEKLMAWAAEAGLRSGTSRTGAYDDAAACLLGGLVLTDNAKRSIVGRSRLPQDLVALVHVPQGETASGDHRATDLSSAADGATRAFRLAKQGRIPEAMEANTAAYAPLFGADVAFTHEARAAGAWAAGLSGTGPAQVALVAAAALGDFASLPPFQTIDLNHGGTA